MNEQFEYPEPPLRESDAMGDPIEQFREWFDLAIGADDGQGWQPTAAVLATAGADGEPAARVVLLKAFDQRGFVFYTNYESDKARQIADNPRASLVFYWRSLGRQVRISGAVTKVSGAESDQYFRTRPRPSQLAATISQQSGVVSSRKILKQQVAELAERHEGRPVPRPANWGGYRVHPERIEFWQGQPDRLHDRLVYTRQSEGWKMQRLAP